MVQSNRKSVFRLLPHALMRPIEWIWANREQSREIKQMCVRGSRRGSKNGEARRPDPDMDVLEFLLDPMDRYWIYYFLVYICSFDRRNLINAALECLAKEEVGRMTKNMDLARGLQAAAALEVEEGRGSG